MISTMQRDQSQAWAVVILNWNNDPDTIATVRGIRAWQSLAPEIWVVDNGSEDDSVERLRQECPGIRLLQSGHNLGFAAGNNLAIRQALDEAVRGAVKEK